HHHRREDRILDRDARDQHGGTGRPDALAGARSVGRQPFRSGLTVVAFRDEVGARTSAGAPSFRLSNRADSTGNSGGSVVLTSTKPLSLSRRPSITMRRASLPLSITQTNDWPASLRTAVIGSVGAGELAA